MRTIQVSTDVFAALWAARKGAEQSEDDILRTLLKLNPQPKEPEAPQATTKIGYADPRNGMQFPEGFEVFRNYLGTEYRASAIGGKWVRQDNEEGYGSLNALNQSVGAKFQNAWRSWYCLENGKKRLLHDLRDPKNIHSRSLI